MGLLSRKKTAKAKGGLLDQIGVKAERLPTPEEDKAKARHEKIKTVWLYLRQQIDKGSAEYLHQGSENTLRQFVKSPAIDSILGELAKLRGQGLELSTPNRRPRTNPRLEVISETLNQRETPVQFVIEERFNDYSVIASLDGSAMREAPGQERVLQATVDVAPSGDKFQLVSVIEVRGATLT